MDLKCSKSVLSSHNCDACERHNLEIEKQAPIIYIPEVAINSPLHLLDARRLTPITLDLGPTCYPRLDVEPEGILREQIAVVIVVRQRMGPRSHQGHIS